MRTISSILLFAMAMVFASSCQQEADSTTTSMVDTLSYEYKTIEKTIGDCDVSCLQVRLKSLHFTDADVIQGQVDSIMLRIGTNTYSSLNAFIDESVEEYTRLKEEIPSYDMPWELERMAVVNYNQNGYIGISVSDYSFTGGAHPNSYHQHSLFSIDDGQVVKWSNIVADTDEFLTFAESRFRDNKSLSKTASFEAEGYWFEGDVFYLPDNFFLDENGINFFYNAYEIAPYSEGAIVLSIGWEEMSTYLKKGVVLIEK
ncbi:MAG: DUF3298 and DUF4163 domain-containing protein [Cryomorphaceae bacterium]|nr:DUF3298 and DUF4163 domain-containing protein [Cryomorphaceae bacterium]